MKPTYLIIGGVSLGVLALMSFVKAKTAQASDVFKKIVPKIGLPKRIDISLERLRFYLDVTLQNPTAQDFSLSSGGTISAKVFRLYLGENLIAFGQMPQSVSSVNLPAGGSCSFNNIYIEIPATKLLNIGNDLVGGFDGIKNLFSGGSSSLTDNLKNKLTSLLGQLRAEVDIEAMGSIYTFKKALGE